MLALLIAAGIPTTVGVSQGISQQKRETASEKRSTSVSLSVYCTAKSRKAAQIHGKGVVLRDGKLFVGSKPASTAATEVSRPEGYPFNGFYVSYPNDEKPLGLVSMSSSDPPAMGFIYVDRETWEVRYGNRSTSLPHVVGPWDWTEDEVGVVLEGKEGFVAVEEEEGTWAVYFDREDDWGRFPSGKRVLEVSLERVVRDKVVEEKGDGARK